MSKESARAFHAKMASDGEFRRAIETAGTAEARGDIARGAGIGPFTREELESAAAELSDQDLDKVAGGWGDPHVNGMRPLQSMQAISFRSM